MISARLHLLSLKSLRICRQCTEEQIKLLQYQEKLEDQLKHTFINLSLSDTIHQV